MIDTPRARSPGPAVAPPALRPGDVVAVVAPSSPFDRDEFERGAARLRDRYQLRYGPGLFDRRGFLAGDDRRRLVELRRAIEDPEVRAIVPARGGYGATRLLDALDVDAIAHACKLLVGFSDVTALHAAWARAGVRLIHGPMVAAIGRADEPLVARWIAAVEGALPPTQTGLRAIARGEAEGPLVGGNLAVLAALAGTPHAPPIEGSVLLLEDVGERPYRVDRMLTTLRQAGWLERVAGVLCGAFTDARAGADGVEVDDVLADRLGDLGVPVLTGLGAGHVDDNLELPLGAPVRLDAASGSVHFVESAVTRGT